MKCIKKLIISLFLMLNCLVLAYEVQLQTSNIQQNTQQNNYTKNIIENNERVITNALYGFVPDANDYIKFSGKITTSGKLYDIEVKQTNISQQKANQITEKLKTVSNLQVPVGYNKFNLYVYSKPSYSIEKSPNVVFDLTNEYTINAIKDNTKTIKKYYQKNYYNKLYTKYVLLNKKNNNSKQVSIKTRIDKSGNLLAVNILKSSQNKEYDEALVKIIKSSAPFYGFEIDNIQTLDLMFEFNKNINIDSKVKTNFNNNILENFEGIVKVRLDSYGNVVENTIARTTNNQLIDKEMLSAIQKTGNFFETINYNEETPFIKYIIFRQLVINSKKPILQITYFSYGDESAASPLDAIRFGNLVEYITKSNWLPPSLKDPYSITALFILDKDGKVTKSSIIKSSNIQEADNSVLRAIQTAKLPKIPEDFNAEYIPVEMTFDYELDPNIDPILKELYFTK